MIISDKEALQLYDYIRYCLYANRDWKYVYKGLFLEDLQHDIFLHLVDKKKVEGFNAGSRRFSFVLAHRFPYYAANYRYRKRQEVLTPTEGVPEDMNETGYVASGTTFEDVVHYELPQKLEKILNRGAEENAKPVVVEYKNGGLEAYPSVEEASRALNCNRVTVYRWLREGIKARKKFGHIRSVQYMSLINPFAGCKLIVKKVVSEGQWENRMDQEDYELEDYNEYYKLWRHKESEEGLLVRLRQPKEAFYIQ